MRVSSLGWEDTLEKGMATPFSIFAWEIPWTEEPSGLQSMGSQESDATDHEHEHVQEIKRGRWNNLPYLSVCPRIVWPPRKTPPVQLPCPPIRSSHSLTQFFLVLLNLPSCMMFGML